MGPAPSPAPIGTLCGLLIGVLLLGCGHTIRADLTHNHSEDFDFRSHSCADPGRRPKTEHEDLQVLFLGVSGLYVEWRGVGLLAAPFFSHASLGRLALLKGKWNREAIEAGMHGLPAERIAGILVAHSHHDHLFDLPVVAGDAEVPRIPNPAKAAHLYLNRSGANMIAAYPALAQRTTVLDDRLGEWTWLTDGTGARLPIRFMPVASEHARQAPGVRWADGEVEQPWDESWEKKKLRRFESGRPLAFIIDLIAEGIDLMVEGEVEPAFRIYFQDAASPGEHLASEAVRELENRSIDLAVFCIASYHAVAGLPETMVSRLRPRHALVTHYRDFFRRPDKPIRFVPLLTNRRANTFLERLAEAVRATGSTPLEPLHPPCGPAAPEWTMPLPGEWLTFAVAEPRGGVPIP